MANFLTQSLISGPERVNPDDLCQAIKDARRNNVTLITRSLRISYSCFDDLDMRNFNTTPDKSDYLINFISNGIKRCSSRALQPVSILWPESYDELADQLAILDAFLINSNFRERPVDWILRNGLTIIPPCQHCNDKMKVVFSNNTVSWQCFNSEPCYKFCMPILRPTIFADCEQMGLDKLLFNLYYWSTCTPPEELNTRMNLDPNIPITLWRRFQNICRITLEKTYPRHRLTNIGSENTQSLDIPKPIDLISVNLNNIYVVCAKHPDSNLVRLGFLIPNLSEYSFASLTESWFAHGALIRVCEKKFLKLTEKRTDLKIELVTRAEMVSKGDRFDRQSAFGYIIVQLAHVLKDCDSSTLSLENLKLLLAEMQWREFYGTNPYDAFTNIVKHISLYGDIAGLYSEPSMTVEPEQSLQVSEPSSITANSEPFCDQVWAEEYFYATIESKSASNAKRPKTQIIPKPDVRTCCHLCNNMFETFGFCLHIIVHVEENRRKSPVQSPSGLIDCKHCFKSFDQYELAVHSSLFRSYNHTIRYGCRICCVRLKDRNSYLQHMRRQHFEHECPYRCPCCDYASSFQRDVFIHFQEEHRYSLNILCPLCLKLFTTSQPETITRDIMYELSRAVYNHLAEHYTISREFTCTNCNLCFMSKSQLTRHRKKHHNPLEIIPRDKLDVIPFQVEKDCMNYCVKALKMELFIANKRPNFGSHDIINNDLSNSLDPDESMDKSDNDTNMVASIESSTIVVRGLDEASEFLDGGLPDLKVSRVPLTVSASKRGPNGVNIIRTIPRKKELTSQRLIDYLSKLERADGILPNQSVILAPSKRPAKCAECLKLIGTDHFVAGISCKRCNYFTYCPRAATKHNTTMHLNDETKKKSKKTDQ